MSTRSRYPSLGRYHAALFGASEPSLVTSGLAHYWPFTEGAGQAAVDVLAGEDFVLGSTGGVDTNDPAWEAGPAALSFETDDYMENAAFVAPTATWSVELLVNMIAVATANAGLIHWLHSVTANILRLQDAGGGFFSVVVWSTNIGFMTEALPVGVWSHVVITYDGTTARSYLNSVANVSGAVAADVHIPDYILNIGRRVQPGTNYADAIIGRPRFYMDTVLSPAQIARNYSAFKAMGYNLP